MNRKWADESSSEDGSVGDNTPEEHSDGKEEKIEKDLVANKTYNAFMSGISYEAKEKDLLAFLVDQRCSVHSVSFLKKEGVFKGSAVIKLNDKASFEICLALHGLKSSIGFLRVKIDEMPQTLSMRHQRRTDDHGFSKKPKEIGSSFAEPDRHRGRKDNTQRIQQAGWVPEVDVRESESVKERPKLNLKPRTLPIENSKLQVPKADIFGGGKPHDELEYEMKKAVKETGEKLEVVFRISPTKDVEKDKRIAPTLDSNVKEGSSRTTHKNVEVGSEGNKIEERCVKSNNDKLPIEGDRAGQIKGNKRNSKRLPKENEKSKDSGRTVVIVDEAESSKQKSGNFKTKKGPVLAPQHRIFKEAVKQSSTASDKKASDKRKLVEDDIKNAEARHDKFEKAQHAMKVEPKQKVGTAGAFAILDLDSEED